MGIHLAILNTARCVRYVFSIGVLLTLAVQPASPQSPSDIAVAPGFSVAETLAKASVAFNRQDYAAAMKWYRQAANQGDVTAQHYLGVLYFNGQGVPKDYVEAMSWFRKAADQGSVAAQRTLGTLYTAGEGVQQNYGEAMKWDRMAADQGDAQAQHDIGMIYLDGRGVQENDGLAMLWFRRAADQGHAASLYDVGFLYDKGKGVQQDYVEAMKWYRKAADQNLAQAQNGIGTLYANGWGIRQDYDEAMRWYRKAADQGNVSAQFGIGLLYHKGLGVPENIAEATKWYRKAADQRYQLAVDALAQMTESATSQKAKLEDALKMSILEKSVPNSNSLIPVIASGFIGVPGAIVCADYATVQVVFKMYSQSWDDQFLDKATNGKTVLLRGPALRQPNPEQFGCTLIKPGTPMLMDPKTGIPFVTVVSDNSSIIHGVTMPFMALRQR